MAKRDIHIISDRYSEALCWKCEKPLKDEIHCGDEGRKYCAEHCPRCREREAAR